MLFRSSDEEAIEQIELLKKGSKQYPVHFSLSDTSGEKEYEEFYTDMETVDLERFRSLGVITGKSIPDQKRGEEMWRMLSYAFEREKTTKEEIISILQDYLPDFAHIEKGRSLDGKM